MPMHSADFFVIHSTRLLRASSQRDSLLFRKELSCELIFDTLSRIIEWAERESRRLASSRLYRSESRKHKRKASLWINCHLRNRQPAASPSIAGERFLIGSYWLRSNLSLRPPARLLKWMSVGLSGLHGKQLIHPDIRFGQSLAFVVRRAGQEPRLNPTSSFFG